MDHLGIFAKYWTPGDVKTRLGHDIGMDAASELYRVMLETTVHRFSDAGDQRTIVFSPPSEREAFTGISGSRWQCEPQAEGDLGERMRQFATRAVNAVAGRVVMLGTDCPHLPRSCVLEAFESLRDVDVVLGPSTDGGYYLVGMRHQVPPIFDGIAWSTPEVFSQTLARLATTELSFTVLPEAFDVDDLAGVEQLDEYLTEQRDDASLESLRIAVAKTISDVGNRQG